MLKFLYFAFVCCFFGVKASSFDDPRNNFDGNSGNYRNPNAPDKRIVSTSDLPLPTESTKYESVATPDDSKSSFSIKETGSIEDVGLNLTVLNEKKSLSETADGDVARRFKEALEAGDFKLTHNLPVSFDQMWQVLQSIDWEMAKKFVTDHEPYEIIFRLSTSL